MQYLTPRFKILFIAKHKRPAEPFGEHRLYVGEFGLPESEANSQEAFERTGDLLAEAQRFGCPYAVYWQLYCNEPLTKSPKGNADYKGFWLCLPTGRTARFASSSNERTRPKKALRLKTVIFALAFAAGVSAYAETPALIVHLLDHTDKKKTDQRFWIDWNDKWRGIVETRRASPEEAEKIIEILKRVLLTTEAAHFCGHDPIYGILAVDSEGKKLKTSLCFKCLTWVKPKRRMDILGKRGTDNELCLALRSIIELPRELLDEESTAGKGGEGAVP